MAIFGKSERHGTPPAPPPVETSAKPPEPPPRVQFEHNEKRKYVRDIVDVRGPTEDKMEVLLASKGEWQTLTKATIDVKAELSELKYGAFYSGRFGEPRYSRHLICRVSLKGFNRRSPLLTFPPLRSDDEPEEPWRVYGASFSNVSIYGQVEALPVRDNARLLVKLWRDEQEHYDYVGQLAEKYQAAMETGEQMAERWPTFVLNKHSRSGRHRSDGPDVRSDITLPMSVFEGLLDDVVAMGPRLSVYIQVRIEAYVLGWGENFGAGEWDDHRWNYDLAIIPDGSVLTAEIDRMHVQWRSDCRGHDWETDEYIGHKETYLDNPDPKREGDKD